MSTDRPPPADRRTPHRGSGAAFAVTRWTLVLRAKGGSPEARAALGELCEAYYAPVMAFIRWTVGDAEKARDLTQEFFARLLAKEGFHGLEPGRGRFRAYLLGAVKHFLADQLGREQAAKRGGGLEPASLQPPTDTSPGFEVIDPAAVPPDVRFDRQWAWTLLERVLGALEREYVAAGNGDHFARLKPWLTGETDGLRQAEVGRELGMSETAVKVAVHRLRKRFRDALLAEVTQTVGDASHADEELRHLLAAM